MALSLPDQLSQLSAARQIVLSDPKLYPQIVSGILPIVGATAHLELQQWGAEFLAETFASPVIAPNLKEQMAISALQTLKELLDMPKEDTSVVKGVVQASASVYGLVFKYIIANPSDVPVWNNMAAIKSNILRRWDSATMGVKICCIKFVQKVVQVQTPGVIADPRRPEQNEISIALVPRDHPLIPPPSLEPEASGLLDRLLSVFQDNPNDAVLVNATLNCLGVLLRTRQSVANKIISAILNFHPLKQANSPITPKVKVQIKSMERTTRAVLLNVYRRNENGPMASRIKAYVDRMTQSRMEIFNEGGGRKRGLTSEPTDGLDNAKRRRLGAEVPDRQGAKLSPHGPNSLAQLYTLTDDSTLASFDVQQLPQDLVVSIAQGLLVHINQQELDKAINSVRSRLLTLSKTMSGVPPSGALGDDEEDYEPDFEPSEDREQILNRADALPPEDSPREQSEVALGPFELPQPPPLTVTETEEIGKGTIARVFGMMNVLKEPSAVKKQKPGLNRLAGSSYDQEAWITIITRLATRASAGLYDDTEHQKDSKAMLKATNGASTLSDAIRDNLFGFILEDFRARIDIAIFWLNEEWYNDKIQQQAYTSRKNGEDKGSSPKQYYEGYVLKVLDGIMPYLDAKDKLLIRFLSEIPVVSEQVLERVKSLVRDPERVDLCIRAIHYLIITKPPAREICIDAVEDLWRNYDDAKAPTTKILQKWRPHILPPKPQPQSQAQPPTQTNGALPPPAEPSDPRSPSRPEASSASAKAEGEIKSPTAGMPVAAAG
ncbi:MAG: hypothetical protein Q9217_003863 [Psora testacea]